ncbi:uncharacterized protein (AIM24 family) [Kineococcus xinjiangensis]|uniref:Uncharacterized protein (AIM24 family) n=1 Tax=Kineococcus xinjiangensis TaxID=512762 RepID=A0A2S6IKA8_9ACTN|nr:AIM24 family protein [Kineococcus xinjiangensis]PPK94664.1 uncharacterized protein (AIM24 family) [Kineococcus xinjiangensis]
MNWRLQGSKVLVVDLNGDAVRAASGSMVAYEGDIAFKSAGTGGGGGLRAALMQRVAGESLNLMECRGRGTLHLAVSAMDVVLVELAGEELRAESEQLLALSEGLRTEVVFAGLQGATSGQGLFTTKVTGHGPLALLSAGGPPIALRVTPQAPLVVDPQAFIASRGRLSQTFVTDVSWRNLAGEGSGEAFSLRFEGDGVVYVQPEERG